MGSLWAHTGAIGCIGLKEDTLVYMQMQLPANSSLPWAIVNDRTKKWLVLLQGVNSACSLDMHV